MQPNLNDYLRAAVVGVATIGFAGILYSAIVNQNAVDASVAALLVPILGAAVATPIIEKVSKSATIKEVDKLTDEVREDQAKVGNDNDIS